jgi:hypothetical protein
MALSIPGVDYAWHGRIDAGALHRAGVRFAMRYVSHDPSKDLGADELATLHGGGIAAGLVWESTANRAAQGRDAGKLDAAAAKVRADALGLHTIPIYFAVDFDARGPDVEPYFAGAAHVLGHDRTGVYAGYDVVDHLHRRGVVAWCWQTYAWSRGLVHSAADVYQHRNGVTVAGIDCDLDRATERGLQSMRGPRPHERRRWRRWRRTRRRQLRRVRARERLLRARERFLRRRIDRLNRRLERTAK